MNQNWKIWEKGKQWFQKKDNILLFILVGILLMVVVWPTSKKSQKEGLEEVLQDRNTISVPGEAQGYTEMEQQLTTLLEAMEGVGRTLVMITYQTSAEQVPLKDRGKDLEEETVFGEEKTGERNPFIVKEYSPVVEGITVVCEGGDNFLIQKNITETLEALFGTSPHKIKVVKMKQTE